MSYGFQVRAATKAAVMQAVSDKFEQVIASQSIHARDKVAVLKNAEATIDLLPDDDSKDIAVTCNGYVSHLGDASADDVVITGARVECYAQYAERE